MKKRLKHKKKNTILITLYTIIQVILIIIITTFLIDRNIVYLPFILYIILWIPLFEILNKRFFKYYWIFSIIMLIISTTTKEKVFEYDVLILLFIIFIIPLVIGLVSDYKNKKIFKNKKVKSIIIILFITLLINIIILPTSFNRYLSGIFYKNKSITPSSIYYEYIDEYNKNVSFFNRKNYFHTFTKEELEKLKHMKFDYINLPTSNIILLDELSYYLIIGCNFNSLNIQKKFNSDIILTSLNTLILDTKSPYDFFKYHVDESYINVIKTKNSIFNFSNLSKDYVYFYNYSNENLTTIYIDKNKKVNDIIYQNVELRVLDKNNNEKSNQNYLEEGDILTFYDNDKIVWSLKIGIYY